jgi:class 3 adenylate cyclase/tetratricopeptide (TPR) repeat protein
MITCPRCGEANPERFRLCGMCGNPLGAQLAPREVRKTVTVVFSDLKGSTTLGERLDPESLRAVLTLYFNAMQEVLQRHGGTVEKYIGDAVMAVFGLPAVHEDDALRAVRAAREMQERLIDVNRELEQRWGVRLENRTGVYTGEVVAGDASSGQRLVSGDTVNTAARLEQAAPACEVLIGEPTFELVRHAVEVEPVEALSLKGKTEQVPAYRLVSVASAGASALRLEAPMVGRDGELRMLQELRTLAERDGACHLATIIGSAGVGKSRLIHEFLSSLPPAAVILRGRCLSYGDGVTFWPLAEALRTVAAIDDDLPKEQAIQRLQALCVGRADLADRLASLLGLSDAAYPLEETFWAARTLIESLGHSTPTIVCFDDIHWAEPTFLDLIENLAEAGSAPVLIVCSARAELLESRPAWGEGDRATRISLSPLSESETDEVVANIVGGPAGLPTELVERITAAAEGNPLFVEQMLSVLLDRGLVRRAEGGEWLVTGDVAEISVPPTISALIAARLERLAMNDRAVLQEGAVIGLVFYERAVAAMSPPELASQVPDLTRRLVGRQFIRPEIADFMDEASYRFDHGLIHDAAYRSLLKRERADFHERFVRWLEARAGDRVSEIIEIVGYHLEQSSRYLAELGPLDERGRALAARAARHLGDAGRRAFSRGDMPAAANLLDRAASLLPAGERDRVELQLDLAETLADLGEFGRSEALASEALEAARAHGDEILATNAALVQLFLRYTLDPEERSAEVVRDTEAAIPILEGAADHPGLVRAWRLLGWVHGTACRYGAAEHAVERAVHHARLAGDRRAQTRNQMSLALAALSGPMPVSEAISVSQSIASDVDDDRRAAGVVMGALAHLRALRGDFDEARTLYATARETLRELGGQVMAATVSLDSGPVEILAGRADLAEAELRRDYEVLTAMGERYARSTVAGLLADAVLRQGKADEALTLSQISEETAASDDVESQNLWRRVQARILTGQGKHDAAVSLGREALTLVAETDAPLLKGGTLVDLSEAVAAKGDLTEAIDLAREALALFEAKRDDVDADTARALVDLLSAQSAGRSSLRPSAGPERTAGAR